MMMGFRKSKLSRAVTAAIAVGVTSPAVHAQIELEEVLVTATKRVQSTQEIPISVQAMSSESLDDLNVANFDDYIQYLPSVHVGGRGPGQSEAFIRGVALDQNGIIGAEFSPSPTVGFYLDEQPVTLGGRNLDIYVTDVERLEVLAGPQGTLFGASAQAGAFRIITNKPQFNEFDAGVDVSFSDTTGGDTSNSFEAFVNVPLIDDKLAARLVVYNDNQGGYIDNVFDTFTTDPSENPNPVFDIPDATHTTVDNSEFVEENFNDAKYTGARLGLKWMLDDNWSALVQHSTQDIDVDGVFDYDPTQGDLNVSRFDEDKLEDDFDLTTWTLEGRLSALEIVYTGGYLEREVDQTIDYIGYNNTGAFMAYYTCTYDTIRECLDPNKRFVGHVTNTRETHELRFTTSEEHSVRGTFGLFYDDQTITHVGDFDYAAAADPRLGFFPNRPIPGSTIVEDGFNAPGVTFINDLTREESQFAVFGEVAFDLSDRLTLTGGYRYFDLEATFLGSSSFATTSAFGATEDAPDYGRNYDEILADETPLKQDGGIAKLILDFQMSEDVLLYGGWSQGYRPGGFNRLFGPVTNANNDPELVGAEVPAIYETDDVINTEFGWKTDLMDGSLRFNGALYFIEWKDIQLAILDTVNFARLTFTDNVATAEIKGVEFDVSWLATDNLALFAGLSFNDTEIVSVNPGIDSTFAGVGSELPLAPELQYNLRARYEWNLAGSDVYAQAGMAYTDSSFSSLQLSIREEQSSYTTASAAIGGAINEHWGVELFVENLTDELAEKHINTQDDIRRITTIRPRTIGLKVSYDL